MGEQNLNLINIAQEELTMADMVDKTNYSCPKFNGEDFSVWRMQMESVLKSKDLYDIVSKKPGVMTREQTKQDNQARTILLLSLEPKFVRLVMKSKNAFEIWTRLNAVHAQKSEGSKMSLQKQFYDCNMQSNEPVADYISRVEYLAGQLEEVGIEMSEVTIVGKIVSGLSKVYSGFVSSWLGTDAKSQTLDNLLSRLMAEETMKGRFTKDTKTSAALTTDTTKGKGKKNKRSSRKKPKTKEQIEKLKMKTKCHTCGEIGHWKRECSKGKGGKPDEDIEEITRGTSSMIAEANQTESSSDSWILDTGATEHMCFSRKSFVSYRQLEEPIKVRFGDGRFGEGIGMGTVMISAKLDTGYRRIVMNNVLHVPSLKRKLISLSAVTTSGNVGKFDLNTLVVYDQDGKMMFKAYKRDRLYHVDVHEIASAHVTERADDLSLWHERFGHLGKSSIIAMIKEDLVDGLNLTLPKDNRSVAKKIDCDACKLAKHAKKTVPLRTSRRATQVGERVHFDLGGPINTPSLEGSKYFVLFKDEFSAYRLIYFVKTKDEVFACIQKAVAEIKLDTGNDVHSFYSDRGSEVMSKKVQDYFLSKSIVHQTTAPFTPSQNGYVEREMRTVMEHTRSMLYAKELPEVLWAEAANTAVYLLNRSLCSTVKQVPYKLYFGRRPRVTHLRVFGCLAFMKKQFKKRSGYQGKLEPRSEKCVHVGYDKIDFTYRLYNPETKKVYISRDISFDETRSYVLIEKARQSYTNIEFVLDGYPSHASSSDSDEADRDDNADDLACEDHPVSEEERDEVIESLPEQPPPVPIRTTSRSSIPISDRVLRPRNNLAEANIVCEEPDCYEEAISGPNSEHWKQAINEELRSLEKNNVWTMCQLPSGKNLIQSKWVFKVKRAVDGTIERFKARLVAKGFSQREGFDYSETFAPVARLDSVRIILALTAHYDLELVAVDVKTAFLYGRVKEELYMAPPKGYKHDGLVCRLQRSIYGLKQAPRAWNECFVGFLNDFGLKQLLSDPCVFCAESAEMLIMAVYVDDCLIGCTDRKLLLSVVEAMKSRFEVKLNNASVFLGIHIVRDRVKRLIWIDQQQYITQVVDRFGLVSTKQVDNPCDSQKLIATGTINSTNEALIQVPYRQAIGCLLYIAIGTRPDIAYAVGVVSRFCEAPRVSHWRAVKRILRYLSSTVSLKLRLGGRVEPHLTMYVDADYGGDLETRRSTSGFVVKLGEAPVVWRSIRQHVVAQSTTEAEFVAACTGLKEIIWIGSLLRELKVDFKKSVIFIDNQGALKLLQNPVVHQKTKHIDIKYKFIRELVSRERVELKYVRTAEQEADFLTKVLPTKKFIELRGQCGLQP